MNLRRHVLSTVTAAYLLIISILYSISTSLLHDEHQFMASAFAIARYGLRPYQDFQYFHMPNLAYLFAPFFFTQDPFLLARLFVGLCGFGICLTIFLVGRSLFPETEVRHSVILAASSATLVVHSPLFEAASGHA